MIGNLDKPRIIYYTFCYRASKEVFCGVALKFSFNSKDSSFCFIVVGSSAGSGVKSPSTEDGVRGPQQPKMRLNQSAKPGDRGSKEPTSLLLNFSYRHT